MRLAQCDIIHIKLRAAASRSAELFFGYPKDWMPILYSLSAWPGIIACSVSSCRSMRKCNFSGLQSKAAVDGSKAKYHIWPRSGQIWEVFTRLFYDCIITLFFYMFFRFLLISAPVCTVYCAIFFTFYAERPPTREKFIRDYQGTVHLLILSL